MVISFYRTLADLLTEGGSIDGVFFSLFITLTCPTSYKPFCLNTLKSR